MHDLLHDEGFWVALLVALGCSVAVMTLRRRHWLSRVGFEAGAASALAALVALAITDRLGMLSLVGLALLGAGEIVARRVPGRWSLVAAVPGAALLAIALHAPVPDWAAAMCFVAIVVVVPCAVTTDAGAPRLAPLLLAATAVGMWATTPDTEHTRVLVGALLGAVLLAADRRLRRGTGGSAVLVGIMVWAAIVDGFPRDGAVVGALACFGVVVLLPLLRRARAPVGARAVIVTFVVQVGVAVIASRVAGLRTGAAAALLISAAAWGVAAAVLSVALRRTR